MAQTFGLVSSTHLVLGCASEAVNGVLDNQFASRSLKQALLLLS